MSTPSQKPAAKTCEVEGCPEPRHARADGRLYRKCEAHRSQEMAQNRAKKEKKLTAFADSLKKPALNIEDAVAAGTTPAAEPMPGNDMVPEPLPQPVEQAVALGKELMPGMLEQLVRQAFANGGAGLNVTVTGVRLEFAGSITITPDQE